MFEEINNNYAAEQQQLNNNVYAHYDNNNAMLDPHQQQVQNIAVSVDAKLTLYSREPSIPLQDDSGRFPVNMVECPSKQVQVDIRSSYPYVMYPCYISPFRKGFFGSRSYYC